MKTCRCMSIFIYAPKHERACTLVEIHIRSKLGSRLLTQGRCMAPGSYAVAAVSALLPLLAPRGGRQGKEKEAALAPYPTDTCELGAPCPAGGVPAVWRCRRQGHGQL